MSRVSITGGSTAGSKRRAATHYGTRAIEDVLPSKYEIEQGVYALEYTFSYDDLPTEGLDEAILRIPAYARIKEAVLTVITPFAGGTSYNLGLYQEDGTVIDADGIDAAVGGVALVDIDTIGKAVLCDGALVGSTASIGAAAGSLRVAATGTFTAGKARLRLVVDEMLDKA